VPGTHARWLLYAALIPRSDNGSLDSCSSCLQPLSFFLSSTRLPMRPVVQRRPSRIGTTRLHASLTKLVCFDILAGQALSYEAEVIEGHRLLTWALPLYSHTACSCIPSAPSAAYASRGSPRIIICRGLHLYLSVALVDVTSGAGRHPCIVGRVLLSPISALFGPSQARSDCIRSYTLLPYNHREHASPPSRTPFPSAEICEELNG
jgi:hypothetical protein